MIIITGGSSGLGKAIADDLKANGENILTLSRRNIENNDEHMSCDISNYTSIKNIYLKLSKRNQTIKALINCAGISSMNLALTTPPEVTERIIRTNLMGTIFCSQIFSPLLIKNKAGRIINFSTIAVNLGLEGESVYVASKSGIEGFSRVLAKELSTFNITVNSIAPGPIRTNLLKGITDNQIKKIIKHQIIKKEMNTSSIVEIVKILLNESSQNITGQVLNVGGF
tara:strand:+ start:384 stop:1061 length:678 start_codon:yes stop_codon:yes gene_type:complete